MMARFFTRLGANARAALGHPSARLLAGLYALAVSVFMLAGGEVSTLLLQLALTAWTLLTALVAVSLTTQPAVAWAAPPAPSRRRLWVQLAVITLVILYTLFRSRALREPALELVPGLGPLTAALNRLDFNLANPLIYIGPALVALLLLGARPAELGLSLPRTRPDWARTGLLIVVMGFAAIIFAALHVTVGGLSLPAFGQRAVGSFLQNGFSEEFLMRGALMTRLVRLTNTGWGIVLSALVFGLWHLDANLPMLGGNLAAALAFGLISQAVSGVGYGIAMQRGGNLAAPTVLHVLSHFYMF